MRVLAAVLGWMTLGPGLLAQEAAQNAAAVTDPWRGMDLVFDRVVPPSEAEAGSERTLFVLVDATPALVRSGFADAFAKALTKHAATLAKTRIGIARVGVERPVLAPSDDRKATLAALRQALDAPADKMQNVHADLRNVTNLLRGRPGAKTILLATLENGDAEDELDATIAQLDAAQVKVNVLTTEAYVADSYWAARPYEKGPRGTKLVGGDAPFTDMPWGWVFQITAANEVTPSGYAAYALNRLAAGTGGRVFLYAGPEGGEHRCTIHGICLFCSNDHAADGEIYWTNRIQPLSASTKPRAAAAAELGADPFWRATATAWRAASQAGLVHSQPPRLSSTAGASGGGVGDRFGLFSGIAVDRIAEKAEAGIKDAAKILAALEAELAHLDPAKGTPRNRALAEFTRVMLQVTTVNLVTLVGFCREIAPGLLAKDPPAPRPPEIATIERDARPDAVGVTNLALCHGARPFFDVELPGGARLKDELGKLDAMLVKYAASYENTPFLVAVHRQGLARFHLLYAGGTTKLDRERPKSKNAPDPTTQSGGNRPVRGGATGTGGGSAGPTTGGGK